MYRVAGRWLMTNALGALRRNDIIRDIKCTQSRIKIKCNGCVHRRPSESKFRRLVAMSGRTKTMQPTY